MGDLAALAPDGATSSADLGGDCPGVDAGPALASGPARVARAPPSDRGKRQRQGRRRVTPKATGGGRRATRSGAVHGAAQSRTGSRQQALNGRGRAPPGDVSHTDGRERSSPWQ